MSISAIVERHLQQEMSRYLEVDEAVIKREIDSYANIYTLARRYRCDLPGSLRQVLQFYRFILSGCMHNASMAFLPAYFEPVDPLAAAACDAAFKIEMQIQSRFLRDPRVERHLQLGHLVDDGTKDPRYEAFSGRLDEWATEDYNRGIMEADRNYVKFFEEWLPGLTDALDPITMSIRVAHLCVIKEKLATPKATLDVQDILKVYRIMMCKTQAHYQAARLHVHQCVQKTSMTEVLTSDRSLIPRTLRILNSWHQRRI